jgi:two-component system, OmpR family, response regulator
MTRVLLVDDDKELGQMLVEYLHPEGFDVDLAHDGAGGAERALAGDYDVVVLDIMMPVLNGLDALREIRKHSEVPVLMLTAKGDDIDRIVGLELGADDYLPKPCNPRELVARLRAILRRSSRVQSGNEVIRLGELELRCADRSILWQGRPLELTSTEFSLLEALARQAGRVVDKEELSQLALSRPLGRYDRSIDMHMSNLRRKLGEDAAGRSPILTVRNRGYQFISGK